MNSQVDSPVSKLQTQQDEVDISALLLGLWKNRIWILSCTLTVTILGITYALFASPLYYSQAIIALKEREKSSDASRLFSQLGGVGGIVASQLGIGNTNLDKIEILLRGHEMAENVINRNNLMPVLFPEKWDSTKQVWMSKKIAKAPSLREGVEYVRNGVLTITTDVRKNVITVSVNFYSPEWSKRLVDFYLAELNFKIRNDVIRESDTNRGYLERQLNNTSDPVLMEKIHSMIAVEIEKTMLVSSQSFEVLESPVIPFERSKPQRIKITVLSLFLGLFASISGILLSQYFTTLKNRLVD